MVVPLYKPPGLTPLEALEALRIQRELGSEKLTYAGRLDPMAEGLLLIVGAETRFQKELYQGMDKVYEAVVLLGFRSDTGDILGRIEPGPTGLTAAVAEAVANLAGDRLRPVPKWSSVSVDGRSLVRQLRAGKDPVAPRRNMQVYQSIYRSLNALNGDTVLECITQRIAKVTGPFRQAEALADWEALIEPSNHYWMIHLELHTASGCYVRTLASELAEALGGVGLLFSLKRTRVGPFLLEDAVILR